MEKRAIGVPLLAFGILAFAIWEASGAAADPSILSDDMPFDHKAAVNGTSIAALGDAYGESVNTENDASSDPRLSVNTEGLDLAGLAIPVFAGAAAIGQEHERWETASIPAVGAIRIGQ
jgi:hypothetical protein